jgi:hypothetical protein
MVSSNKDNSCTSGTDDFSHRGCSGRLRRPLLSHRIGRNEDGRVSLGGRLVERRILFVLSDLVCEEHRAYDLNRE